MVCLYCQHKTNVKNSRPKKRLNQLWRRRQCSACRAVFTTTERIETELSLSVRHPEGLEPFLWQKLFISMHESLKHDRSPEKTAHDLLETVCATLLQAHGASGYIQRDDIVHETIRVLSRYDNVAGAHYAALHPLQSNT